MSDPAGSSHHRPLTLGAALAVYIALDVVAVGMGMGVPIFCILLASGVTLLAMAVLLDPATDYGRLGMPLLLFEAKASFIGWLVLMIVISPVLQLLAMVFGSHVALLAWKRAERA